MKTALLFAGQGSQVVGMGKDLYEVYPEIRSWFHRANQVLGCRLDRICFEGSAEELTQTENAQPGIFLISWITYQLLKEKLPALEINAVAGLSLGEFTALTAARSLTFEDGLKLVRQRGGFMQEACEESCGGMAAIMGLAEEFTREICREAEVELANLNCPGQHVVSGELDKVKQACERAENRGARRTVLLDVAGAYHSRLMASAQLRLEACLAEVTFRPPQMPVVANVTGRPHGTVADIRSLMVQQVTSPVLWEHSMRYLLEQGYQLFIELGPGKALSKCMRRISHGVQICHVADLASLNHVVSICSSS